MTEPRSNRVGEHLLARTFPSGAFAELFAAWSKQLIFDSNALPTRADYIEAINELLAPDFHAKPGVHPDIVIVECFLPDDQTNDETHND